MFNRKKREIKRLYETLRHALESDGERIRELMHALAAEKAAHEATKSACGEELTGQRSRIGELERLNAQQKDEHVEDLRTIRKLNKENGELIQEIATEREKAEQLRHLLEAANEQTTHAEADKRRLQGENRALREKIDEAHRQSTCPADCVHWTSPNTCRTCTRYPKAKDKYEVAE